MKVIMLCQLEGEFKKRLLSFALNVDVVTNRKHEAGQC